MQVEICSKNYQQNVNNICPETPSKLDESINNIIKKEGFIKYKIYKQCVSTNGGNYLGVLYEVDINGKTKDGDKELNIFVKSITPDDCNMKIISIPSVYKTESFTYNELSKIFNELQDEAHVPLEERYKMVKCYDGSNTEAIIMENLARKGFKTGHRMDVVSLKFAEMSIRELAKFHAFSFILKEKRPEYFNSKIKTMKTPYIFGEHWEGFIQGMIKMTMDNIDDGLKDRVEKFCIGIEDKFSRNFVDETLMRCLCHGDYRPNNILAKTIDGEVSEVIPVDYQLLHYGCPILDFFYFIFSCTDQEFRKANLCHLKEVYYETLTKFLSYFDIDTEVVYPRKEFDMDYTEKLDYGLMLSLIILPFMFASENDVPDLVGGDMSSLSFELDDKFKDRVDGIIQDYMQLGFL